MFRSQPVLTFVVFNMLLENMGDLDCWLFKCDDVIYLAFLRAIYFFV